MSKLSFRARALDASKPMPVYRSDEIPDLPDFAAINRAVPQMPTGMEKEEESEHHLQRALSAQQVYGSAEALVIPVPEVHTSDGLNDNLYTKDRDDFKPPKQYVHVQAVGMEQEIPDYDMDSEDETWFNRQTKKMEITPLQFENMMDRLEKGSGQQVVTLQEAKLLLKEDDDLIIAVYDYWLNKRLRMQHALIPQVKTEKRDGSTTNNPYVAFRRRTEKMQTRKNRKNDEASYEKMLKLRRDLNKALTILELMKRREKSKKELLQLTIEVNEKRYQMGDFSGTMLAEAQAQRHTRPAYIPVHNRYVKREWNTNKEETGYRKKREYKKRKHKQQQQQPQAPQPAAVQLPQYTEVDVLHTDVYSSDEELLSPSMSPSDHEDENDPDGVYAFRRKKNCSYHAPILDGLGNWPWCGPEEGGFGDKKYRYSLTSLTSPRRCIGFTRRRIGRGGRIILDRAFTPWDEELSELDLTCSTPGSSRLKEYITHIKENKHLHFRPKTPTEDQLAAMGSMSPPCGSSTGDNGGYSVEFNVESFQNHQEALLQMQREQQEQLLRYQNDDLDSSYDLEHSFSSQPTSRFTLDSATAQFAASAVRNPQLDILQTATTSGTLPTTATSGATSTVSALATALTNGPLTTDNKSGGFSTSPAATVLQLNFPLPASQSDNGLVTSVVTTSTVSALSSSTSLALATKTVSHSSSPSVLKLASSSAFKNDTLPVENHQDSTPVTSIVAMEVT